MVGRLILMLFGLIFMYGCFPDKENESYVQEVEQWRTTRLDSLKGKTGWLNLAGLFWLDSGINTIGSDSSNNIIFPDKAPQQIGEFEALGDSVFFIPNENVAVRSNGVVIKEKLLVFSKEASIPMKLNNLSWFIIKRGNQLGIRLRDYNNSLIAEVNHIDAYPIDPKWRVEATWEPYYPPKTIMVNNQVGMTLEEPVPGALHFKLMGKEYLLEPIGQITDEQYFVMIYDKTSGHETYGSGRYLYVDPPDKAGNTFIDFNKAYNPPCAFTPFATCLFPHETNRLPLEIKAGEKFGGHQY